MKTGVLVHYYNYIINRAFILEIFFEIWYNQIELSIMPYFWAKPF